MRDLLARSWPDAEACDFSASNRESVLSYWDAAHREDVLKIATKCKIQTRIRREVDLSEGIVLEKDSCHFLNGLLRFFNGLVRQSTCETTRFIV